MSYEPEEIRGYSSAGRALRGMQESTVESPVRVRVPSQTIDSQQMRKSHTKTEKAAGRLVMEMTGMILKLTADADEVLSKFEEEMEADQLEALSVYQVLKSGQAGLQRALDEMNDVLNKLGFKE